MIYVLDTSAVIAVFQAEKGAEVVRNTFAIPGSRHVIHAVNLCELYYDYLKRGDERRARQAIAHVRSMRIEIIRLMRNRFVMDAGLIKQRHRIALGDCFAIATARYLNGTVVTSDRKELTSVANRSDASILFIR
jgi:predicted nucleic acid-binding protein